MFSKNSAEQISKALFKADPMNTCCKENDCFDEYDQVAEAIEESLKEGQSLKQALSTEISEWFFDGESFATNRLDGVLRLLDEQKDDRQLNLYFDVQRCVDMSGIRART